MYIPGSSGTLRGEDIFRTHPSEICYVIYSELTFVVYPSCVTLVHSCQFRKVFMWVYTWNSLLWIQPSSARLVHSCAVSFQEFLQVDILRTPDQSGRLKQNFVISSSVSRLLIAMDGTSLLVFAEFCQASVATSFGIISSLAMLIVFTNVLHQVLQL